MDKEGIKMGGMTEGNIMRDKITYKGRRDGEWFYSEGTHVRHLHPRSEIAGGVSFSPVAITVLTLDGLELGSWKEARGVSAWSVRGGTVTLS